MMRIRKEQNNELAKAAVKRFEDFMVVHLNEFFPEHCKALGKDGTREVIREGIERARTYSIVSERDVCKFIDLKVALGRSFDTDPALPWAARILNDKSIPDPRQRLNRLHEMALDYLDRRGPRPPAGVS